MEIAANDHFGWLGPSSGAATPASKCWRRAKARRSCCCRRSAAAPRISTPSPSAWPVPAASLLRPQPRGIGQSTGPWQGVKLEDLAADIAAVIEHDNNGPAFVVGHAFGNRVARMLATARPELVRAVSLVAANVGHNPSPPDVRAAIRMTPTPTRPMTSVRGRCNSCSSRRAATPASGSRAGIPRCLRPAHRRRSDAANDRLRGRAGRRCSISSRATIRWRASRTPRNTGGRSATASPSWSFRTSSHAVIAEQPAAVADALIAYAPWPKADAALDRARSSPRKRPRLWPGGSLLSRGPLKKWSTNGTLP